MVAQQQKHVPVMMAEVMKFLDLGAKKRYMDCTFGGGGHTQEILNAFDDISVVALDCDPSAKERYEEIREKYGNRLKFYDLNFGQMDKIEEEDFDGILFDLGVSSFQLDQAERGFSFRFEGSLDMRMNPREGRSAEEFLNEATYDELVEAIRDFGEERLWKKVVRGIQEARGTEALKTTSAFANLIEKILAVPEWRKGKIHPATKVFQGIRIAVNDEMGVLRQGLVKAFDKLAEGGVMVVISFHSLEDREVKRFFKKMSGRPEHRMDSRLQDDRVQYAKILTVKPLSPGEEETKENPRSRSAKLRVLKKERNIII